MQFVNGVRVVVVVEEKEATATLPPHYFSHYPDLTAEKGKLVVLSCWLFKASLAQHKGQDLYFQTEKLLNPKYTS